ncbi:MAG: tetratricopeptide repeat protein [Planctomycetota bacterium]
MTYPDADVASFIAEHYVGLKINILDRHPDFKEASAGSRVIWAPTLIFADRRGELRRYVGWLPPQAFLAELHMARGTAAFNSGQFADARGRFDTLLAQFPEAPVAPEAMYWQGIAGFLAGDRDMDALRSSWERLAAEHPNSRWGTHASVIEDAS